MSDFGNRLKLLRENQHLSQKELANILNVGNSTLSQYESGKRVPADDVKMQIAQYFNVSLDYLLGNETTNPNRKRQNRYSKASRRNARRTKHF